jgi:hypothetical protein
MPTQNCSLKFEQIEHFKLSYILQKSIRRVNSVEEEAIIQTTPIGMFHYAQSYALSAKSLNEKRIEATHPNAPIRFLYCHAIELYLKAYLLLHGISLSDLSSRALGHNLEKLMSKAVEYGLEITAEHQDAIQLANQANLDGYRDRYIRTGYRTVLLPEVLLAICSDLNQQIGGPIYTAAGVARSPIPV